MKVITKVIVGSRLPAVPKKKYDWDYRVLANVTKTGSVVSGIYCITNETNGKVYIGSSKDIYRRVLGHRSKLEQDKHENKYLQRAFNKDCAAFSVEIATVCPEADKLTQEQKYINSFNATDPEYGYNIAKNTLAPMAGRRMTEESKRKISQSLKKAAQRYEVSFRKSEILKGRWQKDLKYKKKMIVTAIKTHTGKVLSQESIEKMRYSKLGQPSWNKGKTGIYTRKTLNAMSQKKRGVSPPNKGKKFNKTTRRYE